jgi:hypothetical protein
MKYFTPFNTVSQLSGNLVDMIMDDRFTASHVVELLKGMVLDPRFKDYHEMLIRAVLTSELIPKENKLINENLLRKLKAISLLLINFPHQGIS